MKITCPSCFFQLPEKSLKTHKSTLSHQEYFLYHCTQCDLQFWDPMKIIPAVYEEALEWQYDLRHDSSNVHSNHQLIKTKYYCINNIPLKNGRLLDIGCSNGLFLKYANDLGYDAWGIDIDKKSIETAKKAGLTNVHAITLEEFSLFADQNNMRFDVITMWDVLEHLDNLQGYMKVIKKLLSPDGYLAGTVPNRNRLFAEATRVNITGDYPPHHFTWWSPKSLVNFMECHGFRKVKLIYLQPSLRNIALDLQRMIAPIENLKGTLKKKTLKKAGSEKLPLGYLEILQNKKNIPLRLLKQIRDSIFFVPALCLYPFARNRSKIFFQSQIEKRAD